MCNDEWRTFLFRSLASIGKCLEHSFLHVLDGLATIWTVIIPLFLILLPYLTSRIGFIPWPPFKRAKITLPEPRIKCYGKVAQIRSLSCLAASE